MWLASCIVRLFYVLRLDVVTHARETCIRYGVERIGVPGDLVFSAAIMAGFLAGASDAERANINAQLQWLRDNGVCAYNVTLPSGDAASVAWRCSVKQPSWRATTADSIDFSTYVLGLSTNYVGADFFAAHAS